MTLFFIACAMIAVLAASPLYIEIRDCIREEAASKKALSNSKS
jgi:hypothetical protein